MGHGTTVRGPAPHSTVCGSGRLGFRTIRATARSARFPVPGLDADNQTSIERIFGDHGAPAGVTT